MPVARKKVIVRRWTPGVLRGYLPPSGFVTRNDAGPVLDLLDLSGRVHEVALSEVKAAHFVREFNLADESNPERLPRKTFLARPRTEGLWIRLTFRDDDQMEGLAPLDLSLADGLADDLGFQFIPPDVRGNSQRVYVPRAAVSALQVVAVVTTPSRRKPLVPVRTPDAEQPGLFNMADDSGEPLVRPGALPQ